MPTSRRRIITPPFTGSCVSRAPPFRLTICGLQHSSCNIRLSCLPATPILARCLSSPRCRSSIPLGKHQRPPCLLQLFRQHHSQNRIRVDGSLSRTGASQQHVVVVTPDYL